MLWRPQSATSRRQQEQRSPQTFSPKPAAFGADLIVTGAFGRGPLAQRLWGGMTSGLQDDAHLSWLLSH
ncbi:MULTISPECIES: hypothetical protein [Brevundimonas]|jgi:hypothetical protein|uniref:hypothetical protein n=1 Tax=Brevundimonas TaxID=41275 RepID=UPI001A9DDDE6|nr:MULTISPECIES: hypothetical protein [Brevundimonas]